MKRLAVIPARGGSKRIPRKNIRDFHGKPLIGYSIDAALRSELFDEVIVSTDDVEIAKVARDLGAATPFMRPAVLADDFTGTFAVVQHAFKERAQAGFCANEVCCIYATAPLLKAHYLKEACDFFEREHADSLYACCEFPFPIQRAQFLDEKLRPTPVMPECMPMRSQDLPKTYQDAGQFYFYTAAILGDNPPEHPEHRGFILPRRRVVDIDTPEDFELALIMYKALGELGLD
ncbi:MAG: pseudaminic acid cytidylyltransferase [Succinivibrio sp.]|nr:pseudaminic acid cytidylyltransferase [Succinivibrio sp.]